MNSKQYNRRNAIKLLVGGGLAVAVGCQFKEDSNSTSQKISFPDSVITSEDTLFDVYSQPYSRLAGKFETNDPTIITPNKPLFFKEENDSIENIILGIYIQNGKFGVVENPFENKRKLNEAIMSGDATEQELEDLYQLVNQSGNYPIQHKDQNLCNVTEINVDRQTAIIQKEILKSIVPYRVVPLIMSS